jgi:CelD/BcsL family acetyltransferase involved in cellulose biosynthesis
MAPLSLESYVTGAGGTPAVPARPGTAGVPPAFPDEPRREARPFARVESHGEIGPAREAWAGLEAAGGAYQRLDFIAAWAEAFTARLAVVVARDEAGAAVALLPLRVRRFGPLRVAAFAGGAWANYHMGLFRNPDGWRADDVGALLRAAGQSAGVDLFAFSHQPARWEGRDNPLLLLPARESPNVAFAGALAATHADWIDAHFSRATQKKLRKKARKLEAFGALRHARAADGAEARAFLDALYAHKAAQARARGEPDPFACARARALLGRLAEDEILEMHALIAGGRIAATFGALPGGRRLSGLVVSYDGAPEIAAASPGEWLLIEVARDAIARGFQTLDLGVGESRYKRELCEIEEPLYDAAFAVTPLGRLGGAAYLASRATLGWIKRRPKLLRLARRLRGTP